MSLGAEACSRNSPFEYGSRMYRYVSAIAVRAIGNKAGPVRSAMANRTKASQPLFAKNLHAQTCIWHCPRCCMRSRLDPQPMIQLASL